MPPAPTVVPLAHEVHGDGPPLVLVHGITESRHTWDPLVPALAETHTVVTVDLRGHGESPTGPAYDLVSMAADVQALLVGFGFEGAMLVGHSLGGTVVTAQAAAFGTARAVVNVDQPLALAGFQDGLRQLEPMLRGDTATFEAAITTVFDGMAGALDGEERARVTALRRPAQDVVLGVWSPVLESTPEELDDLVRTVAGAITVPYLSLHGIDPGDGYAAWLTSLVPTATVEVWPGLGHYPHLVEPDRFLDRLATFEAAV
jgi:pimeloyl-ACP methyl ester carboxylesterase